jgi:type II secretory pathway pseudopilin PulG
MIELMMSLAVMTVGAAALFSLQGFIARANLYSRRMSQATEIADRWIERLKTDALLWNQPGVNGVTGTTYLTQIATSADTWLQAAGNQQNQYNPTLLHSAGADLYGADVDPGQTGAQNRIAFCTHYRLSWLVNSDTDTALRVEVRVFWDRDGSGFTIANAAPLCGMTADGTLDVSDPQDGNDDFHAVYLSTIIRYTPPQN